MADFTHFNDEGRAKMVDVGEKPVTVRTAVAAARVLVNEETFRLIKTGGSDFHGQNKPRIQLGTGIDDNLEVPYEWLERLRDTAKRQVRT